MCLIDFIQKNKLLKQNKEILFYGGSFNPWHDGHRACLDLAPKDIPIIVLPDHNPHKKHSSAKNLDLIALEQELKKKRKNIFLFKNFYLAHQPNPTINWIRKLATSFPTKSLSLLIGFDNFIKLPTWKSSNELLRTLSALYIVSRQDDEQAKKEMIATYQKLRPQLKVHFLGHHSFENISSSNIRNRFEKK